MDIFQQVYPNLRYDDAKMRQLAFWGMKTLKEYVIYQELKKTRLRSELRSLTFTEKESWTNAIKKN